MIAADGRSREVVPPRDAVRLEPVEDRPVRRQVRGERRVGRAHVARRGAGHEEPSVRDTSARAPIRTSGRRAGTCSRARSRRACRSGPSSPSPPRSTPRTKPSLRPLSHERWLRFQSWPGSACSWQVDGMWNARTRLPVPSGFALRGLPSGANRKPSPRRNAPKYESYEWFSIISTTTCSISGSMSVPSGTRGNGRLPGGSTRPQGGPCPWPLPHRSRCRVRAGSRTRPVRRRRPARPCPSAGCGDRRGDRTGPGRRPKSPVPRPTSRLVRRAPARLAQPATRAAPRRRCAPPVATGSEARMRAVVLADTHVRSGTPEATAGAPLLPAARVRRSSAGPT